MTSCEEDGGETKRKSKDKERIAGVLEKDHPRVRWKRRQQNEKEELGEDRRMRVGQSLNDNSPPLPLPLSWSFPLPALLFHISLHPSPHPLLSISLFCCSLVDLLRQGWRVHALQRLQCGGCMSCGSHSSLACRLHRQLLLQLILDQLALSG